MTKIGQQIDVKNITETDVPCWYDLRWDYNDPPSPTLIISVHEDYIAQWREFPAHSPIVKTHAEHFGMEAGRFHSSLSGSFGFDGALRHPGYACDGFVDFSFPIPQVRRMMDRDCRECRGSGNSRGVECIACYGSGREYENTEKGAYIQAASLSLFLYAASVPPERDSSAKYPQLFTVQTNAYPEQHGASLWGVFSPIFVKHLRAIRSSGKDSRVISAMMTAYYHAVDAPKPDDGFEFGMSIHEGSLHLNCPGNSTGIDPSGAGELREGKGYKFSSHNVDGLAQQFALLAGLGQLNVQSYSYR